MTVETKGPITREYTPSSVCGRELRNDGTDFNCHC